jgi:hypothetical protein
MHLLNYAADSESYNTTDLLTKLQQLLDFLSLPGPVSNYLPAKDTGIPPRPLRLDPWDLHVEAAAQNAVDLMLSSPEFGSRRSFFCVMVNKEVSSHYELLVYSLTGGDLHILPRMCNVSHIDLTSSGLGGVMASPLPEHAGGATIKLWDLAYHDILDATRMTHCGVSPTSHKLLSARISAILSSALAKMRCRGNTDAVTSTFTARFSWAQRVRGIHTAIWAVSP